MKSKAESESEPKMLKFSRRLHDFQRSKALLRTFSVCKRCSFNRTTVGISNAGFATSIYARKYSSESTNEKPPAPVTFAPPPRPGEKKATDGPVPRTYQSRHVEACWYDWWKQRGFFSPQHQSCKDSREKFVMCLPPPNVTGQLHLGHALTVSLQDAIARWNRMRGVQTLWVPGCDHAGIATQVIVEKQLWRDRQKTRFDIGREELIDLVWKWKHEKGDRIYKQMERLGASLDWERACFTMDENLSRAVTEAFCLLHERGLIYRAHRLVNWSSHLHSAVSDIEVEDIELLGRTKLTVPGYHRKVEFGTMTSFAYEVDNPAPGQARELVVSTTRVETMLADVAVAVHPEDHRYRDLHGARLVHPFIPDRTLVVVPDSIVDPKFGTGAVKITPGHDKSDHELGARHGLTAISMLDDSGRVHCPGTDYHGFHRFAARWQITEALKSRGLYRGCQENPMTIPICSRTGDVIEPRLKDQWFVDCDVMAARALRAVQSGRLVLEPANHERVWAEWLGKRSRDWCISRQLWWGHRIPAYRVTSQTRDVDVWVSGRTESEARTKAAEQTGLAAEDLVLKQDEDVLDTWFSSALFPFSVFGWPEQTADLAEFYPTSMLETGADILYFWVARMVMMGEELTGRLPFSRVLLHGMIRDAHGRKMSKSLGNVIDPMDVIDGTTLQALHQQVESGNLDPKEIAKAKQGQTRDFPNGIPECGTDALRLTLCSYNFKNDFTNMNIDHVKSARNFCNKLWQAFRFYDSHLPQDFSPDTQFSPERAADRWILSRLSDVISECDVNMTKFDLHLAAQSVQNFIHHQLCDVYLECVKPDLDRAEPAVLRSIHHTLHRCFDAGLRLLHPFTPFVSEELYQRLRGQKLQSICLAPYPDTAHCPPRYPELESAMNVVRQIASRVLNVKTIYGLKMKPDVRVHCHTLSDGPITDLHGELTTLSRSRDLQPVTEPLIGWLEEKFDDVTVYIDIKDLDLSDIWCSMVKRRDVCESQLKTQIRKLEKSADSGDMKKKVDRLSCELKEWEDRMKRVQMLQPER